MTKTLVNDQFAPVTDAFGFIDAPIDQVSEFIREWRERLGHPVSKSIVNLPFPESLRQLEPLTLGVEVRELTLRTDSPWSAYFVNGLPTPDPWSPVTFMAKALRRRAVIVGCSTMAAPRASSQRVAANVRFDLLGPESDDILYGVRGVQMAWDGSRYVFVSTGRPQSFEEPAAYEARRVRDRFTSTMLERYAAALGIRLFDPTFYRPEGMLIEHAVDFPFETYSIEQAQARWGVLTPR